MRLYHFTARHHLDGGPGHDGPGILSAGIIPNVHPYFDIARGMVWLTDDERFDQPWASDILGIGCDRTEVRIEVAIPKRHRFALRDWDDTKTLLWTPLLIPHLEGDADPQRWFVYPDRIPPAWIRGVSHKPAHIVSTEIAVPA